MNKYLIFLFCITIISACTNPKKRLPYYNGKAFTPEWNSKKHEQHKIQPFSFTNQNGNEITHHTFKNKIYIANFFFTTCPGICPKMEVRMSELQDFFIDDDEVLFLSHSVTPEIDSVSVLKRYADDHKIITHKWHLITGHRDELYRHARFSYFADEDFGKTYSPEEDFIHTENFYLIDKKRRIRGVYNGTLKIEMKRIIEDITALKKEN